MYDLAGKAHYPFDEWMGFKKYQRRSPFVEVKVAEMASESTYRETAVSSTSGQSFILVIQRLAPSLGKWEKPKVRQMLKWFVN